MTETSSKKGSSWAFFFEIFFFHLRSPLLGKSNIIWNSRQKVFEIIQAIRHLVLAESDLHLFDLFASLVEELCNGKVSEFILGKSSMRKPEYECFGGF